MLEEEEELDGEEKRIWKKGKRLGEREGLV